MGLFQGAGLFLQALVCIWVLFSLVFGGKLLISQQGGVDKTKKGVVDRCGQIHNDEDSEKGHLGLSKTGRHTIQGMARRHRPSAIDFSPNDKQRVSTMRWASPRSTLGPVYCFLRCIFTNEGGSDDAGKIGGGKITDGKQEEKENMPHASVARDKESLTAEKNAFSVLSFLLSFALLSVQ